MTTPDIRLSIEEYPNCKIIFTCRTNEQNSLRMLLSKIPIETPPVYVYFKPFTPDQLEECVRDRLRKSDPDQFLGRLNDVRGLKKLFQSNPCLLDLCISKQQIIEQLGSFSGRQIQIYQKFTEVVNKAYLVQNHVSSPKRSQKLKDLKKNTHRLAFVALQDGVIDLFSKAVSEIGVLAIEGCPIIPISRDDCEEQTCYTFITPSYLDYTVAEALFEELCEGFDRHNSKEAYFNKHDIEPRSNIRKFIQEMIQDKQEEFEVVLRNIVDNTEGDTEFEKACNNAKALLNPLDI